MYARTTFVTIRFPALYSPVTQQQRKARKIRIGAKILDLQSSRSLELRQCKNNTKEPKFGQFCRAFPLAEQASEKRGNFKTNQFFSSVELALVQERPFYAYVSRVSQNLIGVSHLVERHNLFTHFTTQKLFSMQ